MKWLLTSLLNLLIIWGSIIAQNTYTPKDTTYTIQKAYQKASEQYPFIKAVGPVKSRRIIRESNRIYSTLENGRNLYLDVFYPNNQPTKKRPAILMIHGGGWTSGVKENVIPMAQRLALEGYVTVAVEYRLSGEAPYPAGVQDLKNAVRWMRAHAADYHIDTDKIAAYGCSAGAHLAALLGTTNGLNLYDNDSSDTAYSAAVQAVLNIDGIVSFIHPEAKPEWTGRSANAWLDSYETYYERWREASPLEYAGKDTPPFLFVNSAFPRFHAGRDDLFKVLNMHNIYYEAHTFGDSPHGFWLFDPWFEPTLEYVLAFLKRVFSTP